MINNLHQVIPVGIPACRESLLFCGNKLADFLFYVDLFNFSSYHSAGRNFAGSPSRELSFGRVLGLPELVDPPFAFRFRWTTGVMHKHFRSKQS